MAVVKPMPCRDNANDGTSAIREFSDPRCLAEGILERRAVSGYADSEIHLTATVNREVLLDIESTLWLMFSDWAGSNIDLSVSSSSKSVHDIVGYIDRTEVDIHNDISTSESIRKLFNEIDKRKRYIINPESNPPIISISGIRRYFENGEETSSQEVVGDRDLLVDRLIQKFDETSNESYTDFTDIDIYQLLRVDSSQDIDRLPIAKSVKMILVFIASCDDEHKYVPLAFELTKDDSFVPYEDNGYKYYARYELAGLENMKTSRNLATQVLSKAGYPTDIQDIDESQLGKTFFTTGWYGIAFSVVDFDFQVQPSKWGWQYTPNQP